MTKIPSAEQVMRVIQALMMLCEVYLTLCVPPQ